MSDFRKPAPAWMVRDVEMMMKVAGSKPPNRLIEGHRAAESRWVWMWDDRHPAAVFVVRLRLAAMAGIDSFVETHRSFSAVPRWHYTTRLAAWFYGGAASRLRAWLQPKASK